jgi:hypothetical protein
MAVQSLVRSEINDFAKYRSMLAGNISIIPSIDFLVIAGGGAGGFDLGGGGGAGGYRCSVSGESSGGGASAETPVQITLGENYTCTVGAGGAGNSDNTIKGGKGSNSVFATITSEGGGGGGARNSLTGQDGGSGGGNAGGGSASGIGTANQGFN